MKRSRKNPWPIAIIAYFAVFISATVGFVILTLSHNMDLVAQDYYAQEIAYQSQIDSTQRAQALTQGVKIDYDGRSLSLELPQEHASQNLQGTVHVYRPSDARLDRRFSLSRDHNGRQVFAAENLRRGLWKVRVNWTVNGRGFHHEQSLIVDGPGPAK